VPGECCCTDNMAAAAVQLSNGGNHSSPPHSRAILAMRGLGKQCHDPCHFASQRLEAVGVSLNFDTTDAQAGAMAA